MTLLSLLAASILVLAATPADAPSGVSTVRAVVDALNAHDVGATMKLFAPGAMVQGGRQPQDPSQIRGWVEELVRDDVHIDGTGQLQGAQFVSWPVRLRMTRLGVTDVIDARVDAQVVDGRIRTLSIHATE